MFWQNAPTKMWGCAEPEWRPLSQIRRMCNHHVLLYHVLAGAIIFSNYWPLLRFCKLNKNNGMKNKSPSKLFIFWNDKAEFGKKTLLAKGWQSKILIIFFCNPLLCLSSFSRYARYEGVVMRVEMSLCHFQSWPRVEINVIFLLS